MYIKIHEILVIYFSFLVDIAGNVPALGEVANFGTDYFLSKIKFLAKCKREFTTKFAIAQNGCWWQFFILFLLKTNKLTYLIS